MQQTDARGLEDEMATAVAAGKKLASEHAAYLKTHGHALSTQEKASAQQTAVRGLEAELAAAVAAGKKLAAEQAALEATQAATDQDTKVSGLSGEVGGDCTVARLT